MRSNINLYKDEDVINQLENQLAAMSLDNKPEKSPADQALDSGKIQIGGKTRKVVKAKRTTDAEKLAQKR